MAIKHALCPGSFDPPTFGHLNIIERGLEIFDKITVLVAINKKKKAFFEPGERVDMLKEIFRGKKRVVVDAYEGLLVDYCHKKKIHTILRGIRTVADYEYELQMSLANRMLHPDIETMFMMTEGRFAHVSSSIIKEVLAFGGSGKQMIHPHVEKRMKEKLNEARKSRTKN
ncbi:pantetheine-phosphate adenylyltransferase [bacterium]|nr:pantetheine-phosphate adenylyltransferase [bacterium]